MTYSEALGRHIDVPIDQLNKFHEAELDAAIAAMPDYPETTAEQIREEYLKGNPNAILIWRRAAQGDPVARDWAGG